eukprot:2403100-Amphidinium_carterae.1
MDPRKGHSSDDHCVIEMAISHGYIECQVEWIHWAPFAPTSLEGGTGHGNQYQSQQCHVRGHPILFGAKP